MARPVKRSVSVAIPHADGKRVLIVQRPSDDEDLPDAWGLPAASLRDGESWEAAVRRAGREKLGVELAVGPEMNRGAIDRNEYSLEMRLYRARIQSGQVAVPQPDPRVTQYQAWRWGDADDLEPAARAGSLCCQLFRTTFQSAIE
jgi:8-oxo-dGTP pyrophosphatase MutT (NUDIX family)